MYLVTPQQWAGQTAVFTALRSSPWPLPPSDRNPPPRQLKPQKKNKAWCQRADTVAGLLSASAAGWPLTSVEGWGGSVRCRTNSSRGRGWKTCCHVMGVSERSDECRVRVTFRKRPTNSVLTETTGQESHNKNTLRHVDSFSSDSSHLKQRFTGRQCEHPRLKNSFLHQLRQCGAGSESTEYVWWLGLLACVFVTLCYCIIVGLCWTEPLCCNGSYGFMCWTSTCPGTGN